MSKSARLSQRRAAEVAARRRAQQVAKRRQWAGLSAVGVVVVVIVVLVIVRVAGGANSGTQLAADANSDQVVAAVTSVPADVLDQVGQGVGVQALPQAITGQPALTAPDGKPLVFYAGAEYCPFCAAERWGMVVALSRFGTFTGLGTTHSSSSDTYPNTPTLTFHGSSYTSDYLDFQSVEMQSNQRSGSGYATLETPTADQATLINTFDAPPYVDASSAGAIPFVDFGNQYMVSGASYSPQVLAGKSATDVASALTDPGQDSTKAILGLANAFTAAICVLTQGQPGDVCTSPATAYYAGAINA